MSRIKQYSFDVTNYKFNILDVGDHTETWRDIIAKHEFTFSC